MAFDSPIGTWTVASLLLLVPLLVLGWYRCRDRVHEIAADHGPGGPSPHRQHEDVPLRDRACAAP